jgi:D-xylose transport system permease protein
MTIANTASSSAHSSVVHPSSAPPGRGGNVLVEVATSRALRMVFVLLFLWVGLALHPETRESFATAGNLSNLTAQVAEIIVVGVGMTLVVLIGGIDLSVGAGMALTGVIAAKLQIDYQAPAFIAVIAALAVGGIVGAFHGVLVSRFRVPPFVATLSGFLAYRGIALVLADARGLAPMRNDFLTIGEKLGPGVTVVMILVAATFGVALLVRREARRKALSLPADGSAWLCIRLSAIVAVTLFCVLVYREGIPVPVLLAAIAAATFSIVLAKTRLGRFAFAIGGNAEAARLSGVPVARTTIAIYAMIGILTAVAGVIAAARTNGVTPGNAGLMRELHVITAVVIGGTSLTGGRGTMIGTIIGALIFGTLSNGMNLMNINSNWQMILTGAILLGASLLDSLSSAPTHK